MSFNLRNYVRKNVFEMVGKVKTTMWKVLIVDDITLKIVDSCFTLTDFKERDVPLIEQVKLKRQPFPQVPAIYFVSPSVSSVTKIINDYKKRKQYGSVHIFFTSHVKTSLVDMIKGSNLTKYIRNFVELNLDFLTLEKSVFSLQIPNDYDVVFAKKKVGSNAIKMISTRLFTMLLTVKERPQIRYDAGSKVCKEVANRLSTLVRKSKILSGIRRESVLVVVDRKIDLAAPLLHEFTYQPMVVDLLDVADDNVYTKEGTKRILDERDPLWERFRHFHLMDLGKALHRETQRWASDNKNIEETQGASKEKIAKIMHRLPEYQKENRMYALHTGMAKKINELIKSNDLIKLATKEQNLVTGEEFRESGITKIKKPHLHVSPVLSSNRVSLENKVRLLLLYLITFGQKIKKNDLQGMYKNAGISDDKGYRKLFKNFHLYMKLEGKSVHVVRRRIQKLLGALRIGNSDEKEQIVVSRYVTKISVMIKDCLKGKLSEDKFPYAEGDGGSKVQFQEERTGKKKRHLFSLLKQTSGMGDGNDEGGPPRKKEKQIKVEVDEGGADSAPDWVKNRRRQKNRRKRKRRRNKKLFDSSDSDDDETSDSGGESDGEDVKRKRKKEEEESDEEEENISKGRTTDFGEKFEEDSRKKLFVFCIGGVTYSETRDFYSHMENFGIGGAIGGTSVLTPKIYLEKIRDMSGDDDGDVGEAEFEEVNF